MSDCQFVRPLRREHGTSSDGPAKMSIQLSTILDADCGAEFGERLRLLRRTAQPYQELADAGGDTVRGRRHSERVERRLEELLPDVAARYLWPLDCYVMVAAAIVHDLGYTSCKDKHWEATCDMLAGPPVNFKEHVPGQSFWANTLGQMAEVLPAVHAVVMLHGAVVTLLWDASDAPPGPSVWLEACAVRRSQCLSAVCRVRRAHLPGEA